MKYIPLSKAEPKTYLSFGANLRERFEANDAPLFSTADNHSQAYVISRLELHADLRIGSYWQAFAQVQSDSVLGKSQPGSTDRNQLDLEQAFIALNEPAYDGVLKLRLGRQQFAFDMQRFVSVRDGPNVRQSYDAVWADYEHGPWRFIGFYSYPVLTRDERAFDDTGSHRLTLGGMRVEKQLSPNSSLAIYYARYTRADAIFPSATGDERRNILDAHLAGTASGFDWDAEAMRQTGSLGARQVMAWAFGSVTGYTFADAWLIPRLGLQIDAASGDRHPESHTLGTFNPLFPNGAYLSLAGYSGYTNFIQAKPSLTLRPSSTLKLMLAVAAQWRQTTADAVYTQPTVPVPDTAGQSGKYTGTYEQVRLDWAFSHSISYALEAVHFGIGDAIRRAGGHDSNYLGVQFAYAW